MLLTSCGAWAACLGLGEEEYEDPACLGTDFEAVIRGLQTIVRALQAHNRPLWDKIVLQVDTAPAQVVMRLLSMS